MVVVGAGNRYLPLDGLVEVRVFDEDGGAGEIVLNVLKGVGIEEREGKQI